MYLGRCEQQWAQVIGQTLIDNIKGFTGGWLDGTNQGEQGMGHSCNSTIIKFDKILLLVILKRLVFSKTFIPNTLLVPSSLPTYIAL